MIAVGHQQLAIDAAQGGIVGVRGEPRGVQRNQFGLLANFGITRIDLALGHVIGTQLGIVFECLGGSERFGRCLFSRANARPVLGAMFYEDGPETLTPLKIATQQKIGNFTQYIFPKLSLGGEHINGRSILQTVFGFSQAVSEE